MSETAGLVTKLSLPTQNGTLDKDAVSQALEAARALTKELRLDPTCKDVFRRGRGFTACTQLLKAVSVAALLEEAIIGQLFQALISLISEAIQDHRGNDKYFTTYLDGWNVIQVAIDDVTTSLHAANGPTVARAEQLYDPIFSALLQCALGEVWDPQQESPSSDHIKYSATEKQTVSNSASLARAEPCAIALRAALQMQESPSPVGLKAFRLAISAVQTDERSRARLWQTGILTDLLRSRFDGTMPKTLEELANALISALVVFGLHPLDDVSMLFQKACDSDDARELLLQIARESKGPAFVQLDLALCGYSSIEIPSLPRAFPPSTGYSLSAWLRIDAFDPICHTTLFGAFDASQKCFLLLYLEKDSRQLILQTSIRSTRPSVRFKSTRFNSDRWYHVALVHRRSSTDPKQSAAMLFVDGEFAEQVKCAYLELPPEQEQRQAANSPGGASGANVRHYKPVQAFFGTPHDLGLKDGRNEVLSKWSLASAHLFQTPLTDEFVAVCHRLGPRYSGNMQDCLGPLLTYTASAELNRYNELLHPEKSDKSDIVTATESRGSEVLPESRILISISPTAIVDFDGPNSTHQTIKYEIDRKAYQRYTLLSQKTKAVAINAAIPTMNEAISRSYGTGVLTGDPVVAVPKALDDATWCLTGSLPLLARLLESARTKQAFLQAVHIFFECVKDNWRISEAMEKGNGFGVLAALIREKLAFESGAPAPSTRKASAMLNLEDRQGLPAELLGMILEFVGYDKTRPENSMIVNPMAYRVLLADFDTWRRCGLDAQKLYYAQFVHFVSHNKHQSFNQKRLVRMRVVRRLIEALKSEDFSPDIVPSVMEALKALLDNSSAATMYRELAMFVAYGLQDERALAQRPPKSMASVVNLRQKAGMWANRSMASSRPSTPGTPGGARIANTGCSRADLAIQVLQLLEDILCDERSTTPMRRFNRAVPNRWLLHLLAEADVRVMNLTVKIFCRSLVAVGAEFKIAFIEKNGGFITLKNRLKLFWRSPELWVSCFAILFGVRPPKLDVQGVFTVFRLVGMFCSEQDLVVAHPEMLPTIMAMMETGLRHVVKSEQPEDSEAQVLTTIIQFLSELYSRSANFRDFAMGSRYVQEILFVLYPVLVGSDRLSAETELQADKDTLSFKGEEVKMRPHSNSLGERPPSVRSLTISDDKGSDRRTPSPRAPLRVDAPRRLSSFVLVSSEPSDRTATPVQFNPIMSPKKKEPPKLNVGNAIVESLLEVAVNLFIDQVCNKDKFNGIGLFLKVPPGFREHQAYFESYVLVHTLTQLWNYLQLERSLFMDTRALTNLSRYCQHMSEAVLEGWFIDGAQPLLDFTGKVLEYLQQGDVAASKGVRLCSQHVNNIRLVFLRVCLWRLAELDEAVNEEEATRFLDKMNYWQTILFSSENQETLFVRLICYLLYMKLVSNVQSVRLAAARLWRTILVQKPTESATLLTYAMGSEKRHLSTGFMKLVSMDDEEFITWIDDNRQALDTVFIDALNKPWNDFVTDENRRTEETAKTRLNKRREKLRQWQTEEAAVDDFLHRYETSTTHWRANVHAQERLKLQRSIQDHQENISLLLTVFLGLEKQRKQPCGTDPASDNLKWQLDETESINRMRMRIVPDTNEQSQAYQPKRKMSERKANGFLRVDTQVDRAVSDNIMSSLPVTPLPAAADGTAEIPREKSRPRGDSMSGSQLLEGAFEMVDDPREADDGMIEDKNRKVMTSLQRGDIVQQLHNISRIVGLEACEGLLVVGKKCLYLQDNYFQRSDGEIVSVSQAPDDERDPYVQLISGKDVGGQRTKHSIGDQETRHWTWAEVLSISKRRFLFRDVSIEVFFTDGRSYLLTCMTSKVRDDLYNSVVNRAPHVHSSASLASEDAWRLDTLRNPEEGPQSFGSKFASVFNSPPSHAATKKWSKGDMSNFQYLMLINTMAGRTFNDLTQYPVFPWVIADYTSEELDLDNPKSFRDLSKPMGCQTEGREAEFQDRYRQFAEMGDDNAPPFHYGTHYSSAMIVSSYLIRLQPFVQSYLLLQGGSFDHADRLFDSIEKAWLSSSRDNMSDVRELTPEFFYLPDFLVNANRYDFGAKQGTGEIVNNVKLPAWAKGDPHIFVQKHREALESPYVSANLHQWIDLVFGFKQRGEAAVDATNVFQHLSYQGAKDLDTIDDPVERLASIGIIHSFGQTPHQVFQKLHPFRERDRPTTRRLDGLVESLIKLPDVLFESDEKVAGLTFSPTQERLLCAGPCRLNILPNCDRYLQWGFADHSLRFFSANTKRLLGLYENTHVGPITTATFADSRTLITASTDCTVGLWNMTTTRDSIEIQPKTYLFGHRTAVTLLAASRVFSTLLSASSDGHILIWGLNRQQCIRVLHSPGSAPVQAARISNVSGHIAVCQGPNILLYTLNGHLLLKQKLCDSPTDKITTVAFYEGAANEWLERELLFTGHRQGVVNVWALTTLGDGAWYLQLIKRLNHGDAVREDGGNSSAAITAILPMSQSVYTGDEEGRVWEWDCVLRQGSLPGRGGR